MILWVAMLLAIAPSSRAEVRNATPEQQTEIMDHIKIGLDAQSKLKDLEDKEKSRREAAFVSDISKRDLFLLTAWRDAHDKAQAAKQLMEENFKQAIEKTKEYYGLPDEIGG